MTRRSFIYFLTAFFASLGFKAEGAALIERIRTAEPPGPKLDPNDVMEFASRDVARIRANIAKALARQSPYVALLQMETLPLGVTAMTVLRTS